jgi:hypothetical protein
MSATDNVYFFSTSYGLLVFNERLECIAFQGGDEHKEAALQEWFACVKRRLEKADAATPCPECGQLAKVCLGCGRCCC